MSSISVLCSPRVLCIPVFCKSHISLKGKHPYTDAFSIDEFFRLNLYVSSHQKKKYCSTLFDRVWKC